MKLKKITTFIIVVLGILCLTGCSKTRELEKALSELEQSSYTINTTARMIVHVEYNGQKVDEMVEMQMYIENSPTEAYSVTTINGEKAYTYSCIKDGEISSYVNQNGYWEKVDVQENNTEITDMMNISIKDTFTKKDGVWVGDVEKLSNQLNDELEDYFKNLGLSGDNIKVTRYDIIVVDGKISSIYLNMFMSMDVSGAKAKITVKLPLEFSKIGETTVTVPEVLQD